MSDLAQPPSGLELTLNARPREIEPGFAVGRVLPAAERRSVGPFVFLDQMGPVSLEPGRAADIRPHPHIGLSTVTYLFEGEVDHRDSLGSHQLIRPGAVNWMTAGKGIAHSERTPPEARARGPRLHGLQLWVGLPAHAEEAEPSFHHHPEGSLPRLELDGVQVRVLAGSAFGATSPVAVTSPLFYVDAVLPKGARLPLPRDHAERAAYVVEGEVSSGPDVLPKGTLAVFRAGADAVLRANSDSRVVLLGGEPLGPRYIWWNFVSSSKEQILEAANAWREGRFAKVPGDEVEFVPLRGEPRFAR